MAQLKVLLADDKEVFREGLARLLGEQEYIEVVSQCVTGQQAIDKVKETEPNVVLIDGNISKCSRDEATREIRESSPGVKVAILTDSENEQDLFSAIESGATGYLQKDMSVKDLVKSIDLIGKGEVVVSSPLAQNLVGKFTSMRQKEPGERTGLTGREEEIVKSLAKGLTNKEIAETLFISEYTVKVHVKNILGKLQLHNRQQLAAYAVQQGLVTEITDTEEKSV
jgi:two-component system NarL family response regulator